MFPYENGVDPQLKYQVDDFVEELTFQTYFTTFCQMIDSVEVSREEKMALRRTPTQSDVCTRVHSSKRG